MMYNGFTRTGDIYVVCMFPLCMSAVHSDVIHQTKNVLSKDNICIKFMNTYTYTYIRMSVHVHIYIYVYWLGIKVESYISMNLIEEWRLNDP